jgi:uncharacterized protein (DUF1697 family)
MTAIVSMLRGVNLGKRRIKMDALRSLYESLGLKEPQTYIQSGNVVFRASSPDLAKLSKRIENGIEKEFGFHSDVILRTAADLRGVISDNPFRKRAGIEPAKLLVAFLGGDPGTEIRKRVMVMDCAPDELHCIGRELYIYFPNGMARPNFKWPVLERMLQTSYTGRNLNTVTKLLEMAENLELPGRKAH